MPTNANRALPIDRAITARQSCPVSHPATDSYAALTSAARLVAQVYGVTAPHILTKTRVHGLLTKANIRLLGRRLDTKQVRQSTDQLIAAGIAVQGAKSGVRAAPHWALPLSRAAHHDGNLPLILKAFQATHANVWYDPLRVEPLLRRHLLAGDFASLDKLSENGDCAYHNWRFLAEPLAVDLLRALPERHLHSALRGCLDHVIETAAAPDPLIQTVAALSPRPSDHATDVALIRVLQGRFSAAEAVFAAWSPDGSDDQPARVGLAATQALIAALRGNDPEAWRHIDAALAAARAGTRKRRVFPNSRAFALALLALARIDSPASRAMLDQAFRAAEQAEADWFHELDFVTGAVSAKAGDDVHYHDQRHPGIGVLFESLKRCWQGDRQPLPDEWQESLSSYRDRALANGFEWVVAECDEVLGRLAISAATSESHQGLTAHQRLGTTTLATLAAPAADWEYSLKALEKLAYETRGKPHKRNSKTPEKQRLVWDFQPHSAVMLSPRQQRQSDNGTWRKGRKIALKRLVSEAAKLDFLLPQDREAAAAIAIRRDDWKGREDYYLDYRGVYALAGHPHIFNASGESVDIVRREPELFINEGKNGEVVISIEPHGGNAEGYGMVIVSERRCEVTRFTPSHQRLFAIIPETRLRLPAAAKPRLLEAVSALAAQVRVQSVTVEDPAGGAQVDADPRPWVRLEPLAAGLLVALVVEPIPDSGVYFAPGAGGGTVFANRAGANLQARRDLAAEDAATRHLLKHCPGLASRPTQMTPLKLPESDQCLELLEQLNRAGARCKWPRGEPIKIIARATTSSLALTLESATDWMRVSGKLAIDQQRVLDLKRLFALLEANPGSRFLEIDGGEFLALTKSFRGQLDDLASLSTPAGQGAMRQHPLATLALDELLDGAKLSGDDDWRELRARLQAANACEPKLPSTLRARLRPYQLDGYRWLARLSRWSSGACLADDMGLGKTVQTLALLLDRASRGPALVVAPTSVVANWVSEARRFAPTLNVMLYTGPMASRVSLLDAPAAFDLYVTTYGVLQNDTDRLAAVRWCSAVLDEAQAIKNPATKRSRAARRLDAEFRLITTGTPIQNNLMDLHSLFSFVSPGLLGSAKQFHRGFALPIERDGDAYVNARLRRLIAPFVLRRLKTEVLDDLPERTEVTLHVAMSEAESTLYEALRQRAVEELRSARGVSVNIGEGTHRLRILAHLTRLRLACCNPRLVLDSGAPPSSKLATFATTLGELLENRHKVLVFSQFVTHLKLLEEYLIGAGISYQYLDGGTPAKARAERISAFQAGVGDVFLISLKAGGIGLNLTAADYVIHMDPWWNPAVEDQASDRAHRIGQTRPVTIYRLVTEGTIEERIIDLHHHKRELANRLLEGTDAPGSLNADELLDLLRQPLAEA